MTVESMMECQLYQHIAKFLPDEAATYLAKWTELEQIRKEPKNWISLEPFHAEWTDKVHKAIVMHHKDNWIQVYIGAVGAHYLNENIPWPFWNNNFLEIDTYTVPEKVNTPVVRWWAKEILVTLSTARLSYGKSALVRLLKGTGKQKNDKGAGVLSVDRGWKGKMVDDFANVFFQISDPILDRHSIGKYTTEYEEAYDKAEKEDDEETLEKLEASKWAMQSGHTNKEVFAYIIERLTAMGVEEPQNLTGHKKEIKKHEYAFQGWG